MTEKYCIIDFHIAMADDVLGYQMIFSVNGEERDKKEVREFILFLARYIEKNKKLPPQDTPLCKKTGKKIKTIWKD